MGLYKQDREMMLKQSYSKLDKELTKLHIYQDLLFEFLDNIQDDFSSQKDIVMYCAKKSLVQQSLESVENQLNQFYMEVKDEE